MVSWDSGRDATFLGGSASRSARLLSLFAHSMRPGSEKYPQGPGHWGECELCKVDLLGGFDSAFAHVVVVVGGTTLI